MFSFDSINERTCSLTNLPNNLAKPSVMPSKFCYKKTKNINCRRAKLKIKLRKKKNNKT